MIFYLTDTSVKHDSITFRLATIAYRIVTMVIVPAYSATITAYLAVRIPIIPFRDLKGFVKNGEYRLGVIPTRYPYKYFMVKTIHLIIYCTGWDKFSCANTQFFSYKLP